jgi:hypothetical protein
MLIIISALIAIIGFQFWVAYSTRLTEQQSYTLIKKEDKIEIRHYPSAIMASVKINTNNYTTLSFEGFRILAQYIFGKNHRKENIAMTSPVHMNLKNHSSTMSFVMPSVYTMQTIPHPDNPTIQINAIPDEYVACIIFGGFFSKQKIKKFTNELDSYLSTHNIPKKGEYRLLGYNPPYQWIKRRNEIIVAVEWNEKNQ